MTKIKNRLTPKERKLIELENAMRENIRTYDNLVSEHGVQLRKEDADYADELIHEYMRLAYEYEQIGGDLEYFEDSYWKKRYRKRKGGQHA